jgi:two-component system, NarL family, sensor histidine kinase EvgS
MECWRWFQGVLSRCRWPGPARPVLRPGLVQAGMAWALVFTAGLAAAATPPDWLTPTEQAWLAQHPVVRIGVDPGYAPYAFLDKAGQFQGVAADTLAELAPMLGLQFELVRLPSWAAILKAAQERRIDLITTAAYLPEREAYLAFSRLYIHTPLVVMTRQETRNFNSPDDIADLRVALVDGYSSSRRVEGRYPDLHKVLVKDPADGLLAVAEGRADAYVGVLGVNLQAAREHGLSNLKVNVGFDSRENGQRLAVRKDWAPLAAILSKALDHIPESQRQASLNRWLPLSEAAPRPATTILAPQEARWLEANHEVRVGFESDQAPFSYIDAQGQPAGLLVDSLRAIQQRTGLRLHWVAGSTGSLIKDWREGQIDMFLLHRAITRREAGLTATDALYQSSYLLVCQRGQECSEGLKDFDGRAVAVRRGSLAHDDALRRPQVRLVPADTLERGLQLLSQGQVDAVMAEARSLLRVYDQASPAYTNLQFGGAAADGPVRMNMAARSDWPELLSILNHGLEALPAEQLARIRSQWVGATPPPGGLDRQRVWRVAGAAALLAAVFLGGLGWSNRRLRREVAQRREAEQALARARDEAQANSRHKSDFVARTSHELRTPLNAILGTQHLLETTALSEQQQRYLKVQATASSSLLALANDLLDLARVESGQLELRSAPVPLASLFSDCLALVADEARKKGLSLKLEVDAAAPLAVLADGERLQQVLVNLLGNAVKYTPAGQIVLSLKLRGQPADTAQLCFAITDTGPGIDAAQQARMFEPFQQARASGSAQQGVGLGLAIAHNLVQRMGGELTLQSQPGQGSCFQFSLGLPVVAPGQVCVTPSAAAVPAADTLTPVNNAPLPPLPWRVLLVEDNEVNRLIVREVLGPRGCAVQEAPDGATALTLVQQAALPHLVLMDLGLPDIDGLEVTRRIRALPGAAGRVPILGLTASALLNERENCLAAGMQDVMHKPFLPDTLWACMRAVLAGANGAAAAAPH